MSNQTGAAIAAIANAVNWERRGLDLQAIIEAGNKGLLGKPLTDWLLRKDWVVEDKPVISAKKTAPLVKLISGNEVLELEATDGKETIATADGTFPGYIDSDFDNWGCNVESVPTERVRVSVCEIVTGGIFLEIFGSMRSNLLNNLCLTQPQIIHFVQKYHRWLREDGYSTFFLFKTGDEFFVADVRFDDDDRPGVDACRYWDGHRWRSEFCPRIVVPQLIQ